MDYLADPGLSGDVSMQIGYADRILLNKIDLVAEAHVCEMTPMLSSNVFLIPAKNFTR